MKNGIWMLLVFGLTAHLPVASWAEGEGEWTAPNGETDASAQPASKKEPTPEELQRMMEAMTAPMADMMGLMLEGMAKTMAKPEIAENFATFTRNYYDALVTRGFTEEEAMKIVTASGLPSMGSKQ